MNSPKITNQNKNADIRTPEGAALVKGTFFNQLHDDVSIIESDLDTAEASISTLEGKLLPAGGQQLSPSIVKYTTVVTLTVDEIVGTDAGDLGHTDGAILVAAPGAGYALEFVSAVLVYDYAVADYTGGTGDDLVVRQGSTSVSSAIADTDLLLASADKIVKVASLAAVDLALTENSTLNLKSTAITQPGTAAGVIRVHITYNVITTGL